MRFKIDSRCPLIRARREEGKILKGIRPFLKIVLGGATYGGPGGDLNPQPPPCHGGALANCATGP